jgi:hypothetical protein
LGPDRADARSAPRHAPTTGRFRPGDLWFFGAHPDGYPKDQLQNRYVHDEFANDATHQWQHRSDRQADGYDGVVNDYSLVRTTCFDPRGTLSDDELAAEHISGMRWWRHRDIAEYSGTDLFSPRDIATPLAALIAGDIPTPAGTPPV